MRRLRIALVAITAWAALGPATASAQQVDPAVDDLRDNDVTFEEGALSSSELGELDAVAARLQSHDGYFKVVVLAQPIEDFDSGRDFADRVREGLGGQGRVLVWTPNEVALSSNLDTAEEVVALCDRYGFAYYGDWAHVLIGWAQGLERPAEGVERIESALARFDATRAQARRPYYLSLLAETYTGLGNREKAASILDAAITMAHKSADCWWLPALYLQKSELDPPPQRAATLRSALEVARAQNSRSLERRILASPLAPSI